MGNTLLVTGASRGLGRAIAEYYLDKDWKVFGCSRSASELDHPNYFHFEVDIANEAQIKQMFIAIRKQVKVLDALVNNAGIASMNAFALTPLSSYEKIFSTNVQGTMLCCQKALGLLKRAPNPRIVNMTTVAVPLQLEGESLYAASKSAVETLTQIIAKEYGGFGITCNAIGPSPIQTNLIAGVPADKIKALVQRQAIKKMATAEDVLNMLDFYLSPNSDMVTGQIMYLGGIAR